MKTKTILLIDDNEEFREVASCVLLDAGYDVWEASCPEDAFPLLRNERFDLIICDLHMPFSMGPNSDDWVTSYEVGVRTIRELSNVFPEVPIVAMSSTSPTDLNRIGGYLDPVRAYSKPNRSSEIVNMVQSFLSDDEASDIVQ